MRRERPHERREKRDEKKESEKESKIILLPFHDKSDVEHYLE